MKNRGETQFPEAGVVRERPTYAVYTGTQPHPAYTGIWRRKTAQHLHEHAQTPEATAERRRMRATRAEYLESQRNKWKK